MWTWLRECFTIDPKPDECIVEKALYARLTSIRDNYFDLIRHIDFMARYTPRREVKEANDAFVYLREFVTKTDVKTRKWPTSEAFLEEMDRRRGAIYAAHVASRAGGPNVIDGSFITKNRIEPDKILQKAIGHLQDVVIVGYDKEGVEYFCSSYADAGEVLWHLRRGEHRLMAKVDEIQEKGLPK